MKRYHVDVDASNIRDAIIPIYHFEVSPSFETLGEAERYYTDYITNRKYYQLRRTA